MFKVNPDGMRMEPTPERVLSVCRLIAHKSMTRDEVRKAMTLGINDEKELDQINKSIDVALKVAVVNQFCQHILFKYRHSAGVKPQLVFKLIYKL